MIARAIFSALLLAFAACAHAQTPEERLFEAIEAGKPLVAEGLVVRGKVDLNACNKEHETPLHYAALYRDPWFVDLLLAAKADPKVTDLKGNTLLHATAAGGHEGMVEVLLSIGVDPQQRNRAGQRRIDVARERGYLNVLKLLEKIEKE